MGDQYLTALTRKALSIMTDSRPVLAYPDILAEHVRRVVDAAPPFSPAQRATLGAVVAGIPDRPLTGCPCGCTSRPPYNIDPDCIRNKPIRPAQDWAVNNYGPEAAA
jgi:hypothetical protein